MFKFLHCASSSQSVAFVCVSSPMPMHILSFMFPRLVKLQMLNMELNIGQCRKLQLHYSGEFPPCMVKLSYLVLLTVAVSNPLQSLKHVGNKHLLHTDGTPHSCYLLIRRSHFRAQTKTFTDTKFNF